MLLELLSSLCLIELTDLNLCEVAKFFKFSDLHVTIFNSLDVQCLLHLQVADKGWCHAITENLTDSSVASTRDHPVDLLFCPTLLLLFKDQHVLLFTTLVIELLCHGHSDVLHLGAEILLEHGVNLAFKQLILDFCHLFLLDQMVTAKLLLEELVLVHEGLATLKRSLEYWILATWKECKCIIESLGINAHANDILVSFFGTEAKARSQL